MLSSISHAQDALEFPDRDLLDERDQLRQRLSELESVLGRHDPALIEILSSLAGSSALLSLYSEASALFDRSLQIQRLNLGLFTTEQIPLIFAKMDVDARAGDWDAVNASLDYLYWLLVEKDVSEGEALTGFLSQLSEFHLRGVTEDAFGQQAHHYQQAYKITYQALKISEKSMDLDDRRIIDLTYSLVKQIYLQSAAVERGDETAYALRAVIPRSKWVRPRHIAQSRYYSIGSQLLNDIRRILTYRDADAAESLAMLDVYTADWHLLFNQDIAEAAYKNAFVKLQEAGVDPSELALLFATPKILPVPAFHDTVTSALNTNYSTLAQQQAEQGNESNDILNLQKWMDAMPIISFPINAPPLEKSNQEYFPEIRLRFHLDSLNRVSRWLGGRYRTNMGVATEFETDESSNIDIESLDEHLYLLHFRPYFENGSARPWEGTLLYPVPMI